MKTEIKVKDLSNPLEGLERYTNLEGREFVKISKGKYVPLAEVSFQEERVEPINWFCSCGFYLEEGGWCSNCGYELP